MDKNLTNVLKLTLDNRKIPFNSLFITATDKKKNHPTQATSAVTYKNDENFSGVLALWIQSIQILFRIHFSYPYGN